MTARLADQDARDRIAHDLDTTLVVEAAAGTGKTTALVGRILGLVRTGRTRLGRVVAVTFTEKAAGEMKIRLRTEIERARAETTGPEADRLDEALQELEAARIGTIHALCGDLLRERPVEAGIDPMFETIGDEDEGRRLFQQAFDRWYPQILAAPPEGVRRVLRRPARRDSSPRDQLADAGWRLAEHRDFTGTWRRDPFARTDAIDDLIDQVRELGALDDEITNPDHWVAKAIAEIRRWSDDLDRSEAARGRDHDALEARLRSFTYGKKWEWRGFDVAELAPGLSRDDIVERRDELKAALDDVVARCDADLAACLHADLQPLVAAYTELKRRAGALDFVDLLVEARDLLRDHDDVRAELQKRFAYVLVDEFQDTDPLQVEIVMLLAGDVPGKLFVVGDPKQSIYRFRRADIAIYEAAKAQLTARGADVLQLSVSFRADPRIQAAVNAAFAPVMTGGTQASYVPLQEFREADLRRPAVVALPVPAPYAHYGKILEKQLRTSLPGAVAGWVDWLLKRSGWEVDGRPLRSSDVCLLFRRFKRWNEQVTSDYVRGLETRGIPHVLVGGRTLHDREEVAALRNALTAIEWPDDELSVFATLKGPLFAVADDAMLAWKASLGKLHPLRPLDEAAVAALSEPLREVADALAVLKELHRGRNRRPVADTVGRLLEATRAHAGFANWNAGDQVLANVLRVAELGRRFEAQRQATSFRAFVEHLADAAERGGSSQAPVIEEGTEGVRLMTVHKAKGLEFPVVVLCDMTASEIPRKPTRHVDPATHTWYGPIAGCVPVELLEAAPEVLQRDREEAHRLLYVAATRARDVLVVPGVGDGEQEGWVQVLNPAIYPKRAARGASMEAPGCPPFGDDTVADRPDDRKARRTTATVRPGLHRASTDNPVVWWDPTVVPVSGRPKHGLRSHWLLAPDPDTGRATRSVEDHHAWLTARTARLAQGGKPTLRVLGTREKAETPRPDGGPVELQHTTVARDGRPSGTRFGALVHQSIATVPLDGDAAAVASAVAVQARVVGASDEEIAAAGAAVVAALAHPLFRRAAAADELRREDALSVFVDRELVEGTLDLAFREGGRWTVLELKTSLATDEERTHAEEQLRWYVRAVATATGQPTEGLILMV